MFASLTLPAFLQRTFIFSLLAVSTSLSQADLIIEFDFVPQEDGDLVLTAENQAIFNDAADFPRTEQRSAFCVASWNSVIKTPP